MWTIHSVLSANDNDINDDDHSNNINFTIKDIKLYVTAVTLSAKDNLRKLLKFPNKGFERSVY